jgi:hypothetical protein
VADFPTKFPVGLLSCTVVHWLVLEDAQDMIPTEGLIVRYYEIRKIQYHTHPAFAHPINDWHALKLCSSKDSARQDNNRLDDWTE